VISNQIKVFYSEKNPTEKEISHYSKLFMLVHMILMLLLEISLQCLQIR